MRIHSDSLPHCVPAASPLQGGSSSSSGSTPRCPVGRAINATVAVTTEWAHQSSHRLTVFFLSFGFIPISPPL